MTRMRVVIPGGSGQVGTMLARALARDGQDVVVLTRNEVTRASQTPPWRIARWDARTVQPEWLQELDGADVVINLAGRSVNCRE